MALSETEKYEDILRKSRTAYYAGAKPTSSDISAQEKLLSAKKLEEKKKMELLKEKWYGDKAKVDKRIKDEKGLIGKVLHAVGTPLYGISGTIAHALGRGSEKDLLSNIKASVKEERCYDDKTEVLTNKGWKFFKDLKKSDQIATLNPKSDKLEYQYPIAIVKYDNENKELVRVSNRTLDIAVTPNHNMWVSTSSNNWKRDKKNSFKPYRFVKAGNLPNTQIKIKRNCLWDGNKNKEKRYSDEWFALMGIYLADGCMANHGTAIYLSIHKKDIYKKAIKLLKKLNYRYSERKGGGLDVFVGKDVAASEFTCLGTASKKYIPDYIKFAESKKIKIFLKWFCYGDGHVTKDGNRKFFSSSKKLIDDIQECLIKIGNSGNISFTDRVGEKIFIKDHWTKFNFIGYYIYERVQKRESSIAGKKDIFFEKYDGYVYCAEVKNRIMLVRRNGKAYFCGNTMGDLLRGYGMSNYAAMPLGFALDVAFDPISWLTLGSSGIVGATARGAAKKGLFGAALGAKARGLEKAVWAAEKVPEKILGKKILSPEKYKGLAASAERAKVKYEKIAGDTIEEVAAKSQTKRRFFDKLSEKADKSEFGRGINKVFGYFATKQLRGSMAAEDLARKSGKTFKESASEFKKEFGNLKNNLFGGTVVKKGFQSAKAMDAEEVAYKLAEENKNAAVFADTIQGEIKNIKKLFENNKDELAKFTGMKEGTMNEIANTLRYYKIDINSYDRKVAKLLLSDKNRKALRSYGVFTGMFKTAKIGGNLLTAGTNAVVGNVAMTSMMGVNILSPGFRHGMGDAIKMMKSRDLKVLKPFLEEDAWVEIIHKYPKTFEAVFGINARAITDSRRFLDDFTEKLFKSGEYSAKDINGFKHAFDDAMKGISVERRIAPGMVATAHTAPGATQTSLLSSEILRGPFTDFLEKLRLAKGTGAKEKIGKLYYKAATTSMEAYNKVDQTYRIGLSLHLTKNGLSEKELRLIMKRVPIGMTDITKVGNKFKLSPVKAMEIAQETYMNYLAMPAFVQMMRTIPLVGFPFLSFAAGMTALSAKTAMYNPAFYNKVQFLLKEISGDKSPYEKEALDGEYYNWLNRPGMVKLPFFQENPLYLNVANMIPHYTMNILQPSERNYKSRYGGAFANIIDKLPFFKSPDGQIALDYVILPTLLQDERPQGMFGQPLWETDAGLLKKTGYMARAGIESVMPPMAGFAGLGTVAGMPPEEALPFMPLDRFRQLGYATKGKTRLGIEGKEIPLSRTARVMSAMAGLPVYPMDLKYQKYKKTK